MSVFDVFKKHKEKKEAANKPVEAAPSYPDYTEGSLSITDTTNPSADSVQNRGETVQVSQPAVVASADNATKSATPSWINAGSYEAAAKQDPNISRGQYAYEVSKYRREQGQPDLSYAEWSSIIKDKDPYETEAERQKREKNMRLAKNINAIGSFINSLVNYNRVNRGHVGYTPDKGTDMYNRLERIRQGQEKLAQSRAKDYLGAITLDRAERAKAEAAAAAAQKSERDYQLKVKELEWKMKNAQTEAERKKAADDLAAAKFAYQKEYDAAKQEEVVRHNKATEATAKIRAEKTGSGKKEYLELHTGSGKKRYTPDEYGSNWIHRAYQDMLKEPDGKKFAVVKTGGYFGGSTVPSQQEMYEAITKYNDRLKTSPWHSSSPNDDVAEEDRYDD